MILVEIESKLVGRDAKEEKSKRSIEGKRADEDLTGNWEKIKECLNTLNSIDAEEKVGKIKKQIMYKDFTTVNEGDERPDKDGMANLWRKYTRRMTLTR